MALGDLARKRNVVLVVEDDPPLRELYRASLTAAGYAVFAVEDGLDALRYVEVNRPAVIVLDIGLPRLSGVDVQRELAAHSTTQDIPLVVVTGDTSQINESDFSCVLKKPIDAHALIAAVHRCLTNLRRV